MKRVSKLFVMAVLLLAGSHAFAQKNHEYVDLGLPSGTLWATCNVGANKPEDYGNYYAWGETQTKTTYDWHTYKYAKGDSKKLTKYCCNFEYGNNGYTDDPIVLNAGDDPAALWGSGWRSPSKEQWEELTGNTTIEWITSNGVRGCLFKSKKNGKTIFMPAAGARWDNDLRDVGYEGCYWSRSLETSCPRLAWCFSFESNQGSMAYSHRSGGYSVRPVRKK